MSTVLTHCIDFNVINSFGGKKIELKCYFKDSRNHHHQQNEWKSKKIQVKQINGFCARIDVNKSPSGTGAKIKVLKTPECCLSHRDQNAFKVHRERISFHKYNRSRISFILSAEQLLYILETYDGITITPVVLHCCNTMRNDVIRTQHLQHIPI